MNFDFADPLTLKKKQNKEKKCFRLTKDIEVKMFLNRQAYWYTL